MSLIPEDADERKYFDHTTRSLGMHPLALISNGLRTLHRTAEYPNGSYAKLMAIYANEIELAHAELEASQAREAQMREVLKSLEWNGSCIDRYGDWHSCCSSCDGYMGDGHSPECALAAALALPNDTTALDARIRAERAKERERCARVCATLFREDLTMYSDFYEAGKECANAIHTMEDE